MSRKLPLPRLIATVYLIVAGGTYGLEDLIGTSGYATAILLLVLTPLLFGVPTALAVGELASALPEEGGYYVWVKRALGPRVGFWEAWLSLCASFFDMAIYPTLFVTYLAYLVPGADQGGARLALGLVLVVGCALVNLRGVRSVGGASAIFLAVLLAPFVVFAWLAWTHPMSASPPSTPAPGIGVGLLVAMWNYMGWDNASTFAAEVEHPQRNYPRAMLAASVLVTVTYVVPVVAAWRTGVNASLWTTGAWVWVAEQTGGPWLRLAMVVGGAVSAVGLYNTLLLSYSRLPAVLAHDGLLPPALARCNAHGVPVLSVVLCSVVYTLGLFLNFRKLVELDLLFYGAALTLEFVALVVLRVREPELPRPFRVPGGLVGAVLLGVPPTLLFAFGLGQAFSDGQPHTLSLVAGATAVGVGVVVWKLRRGPSGKNVAAYEARGR